MPLQKRNFGPCAIKNCQNETLNFCKFTELVAEKLKKVEHYQFQNIHILYLMSINYVILII
jgi:hypothetical protein